MSRAVLSIGSNLGDPLANLRAVRAALGDAAVAVSAVYRTPPWGGVEQPDFLNAVVVVDDPNVDCRGWLRRGQALEAAADRVRAVRWGPRTLDVDVVTCADRDGNPVVSDDPELTLPHPRAHERAFVLRPWLEVEPAATLWIAGAQCRVADLLAQLDPTEVAAVRRHSTLEAVTG